MTGTPTRLLSLILSLALLAATGCSSSTPGDNSSPVPTSTSVAPDRLSPSTQPPDTAVDPEPFGAPPDPEALETLPGALAIRTTEGNLVVTAPSGSSELPIADGLRQRLSQPTWSNSADRLAWSSVGVDGSSLEMTSIGSPDSEPQTDGAITETFLDSPPFYLSWSPDDSSIGALRPTPGSIEFLFIDTSTGAARPVGNGQPFYFDWRDSTSVIAAVNGQTLLSIDATGTTDPVIEPTPGPLGVFQAPAAVDGQTVVALDQSGRNVIVELGSAGRESTLAEAIGPVSLAANPRDETIAVLVLETVADSQVIAFQNQPPRLLPSGRVSVIDRADGEVTTRPEQGVLAMQWSPDGSRLALLQTSQAGLQWLIADGDGVVRLTPFLPSREFTTSYLPFADQYNHSSTWWSPDSRALVFAGTIGDQTGIWVDLVDDEDRAALVAAGDIAVWSPQ